LKAGAEPTLSWQQLTFAQAEQCWRMNLEVQHVPNRDVAELAEKNDAFQ
jgi:hypothetical protein